MSFWLTLDEETRKLTELTGISRERISDRQFNLDLGNCPMKRNVFYYMIADVIRNMRVGDKDWLSIGYADGRKDNIQVIQTYRSLKANGFMVELVVKANDIKPFEIYSKVGLTTEETIDVFEKVLCDFESPDISSWDTVTDIVQYSDNSEED